MSEESKTADGGTAFPVDEYTKDGNHFRCHTGMTLRDYFAAHCLSGLVGLGEDLSDEALSIAPDATQADVVASQAYFIADAMLKARNK